MRARDALAATVLVVASICSAFARDRPCESYGPKVTKLTGTVIHSKAFGAPGYGENPETDTIETFEIIKLDDAICVEGVDEVDVDEPNIDLVQLVFVKPHVGRALAGRVKVTGQLLHQITGHHHTTVLMIVDSIEPYPPRS